MKKRKEGARKKERERKDMENMSKKEIFISKLINYFSLWGNSP